MAVPVPRARAQHIQLEASDDTALGARTPAVRSPARAGNPATLDSVSFVNSNDGWAVGEDNTGNSALIIANKNGGATWTPQNTGAASGAGSTQGLNSVSFVDANDGWAVGGTVDNKGSNDGALILATTNGGATWTAQDASSAGSTADLDSIDSSTLTMAGGGE